MKITIAVVFGGNSTEHEISVISAVQALGKMDHGKYDIYPVYMTKDSLFYTDPSMERIESFRDIPALTASAVRIDFVKEEDRTYMVGRSSGLFAKKFRVAVDLVFPIVHGTNVEDGTLQGYFRTLGLPLVGPGVLPSALGMDKVIMKSVLKDSGIPVLDCVVLRPADMDDQDSTIAKLEAKPGYPMIIKPVNLGSSIGISVARDRDSLKNSLALAFEYSDKVLAEHAISDLQEINCSVFGGGGESMASECEEPLGGGDILSFQDKYMSGGKTGSKTAPSGAKAPGAGGSKGMASLTRRIPANISPDMRDRIRDCAKKAFEALEGEGVARIDFMIDKETGKFYLNEINTIPGSLAFYLWEPLGVPYTELLEKLIKLALDQDRRNKRLITSFNTNILSTAQVGGVKK